MKSIFAPVAAALLATSALAQLSINTPVPNPVICQPVLLTWGGGTPPYFLSIGPGGEPTVATLLFLGLQTGTSLTWTANLTVGTPLGLVITDSTGQINNSGVFTIQPGSDTSCLSGATSLTQDDGTSTSPGGTGTSAQTRHLANTISHTSVNPSTTGNTRSIGATPRPTPTDASPTANTKPNPTPTTLPSQIMSTSPTPTTPTTSTTATTLAISTTSTTPTTPVGLAPATKGSSRKNSAPVLAGAIVGAVAGLLLLFLFLRRRGQQQLVSLNPIVPFALTPPSFNSSAAPASAPVFFKGTLPSTSQQSSAQSLSRKAPISSNERPPLSDIVVEHFDSGIRLPQPEAVEAEEPAPQRRIVDIPPSYAP